MYLKNPFPDKVRYLYLYNCFECWQCGCNQMIELHHIWGRISASALNSAPLCKGCHVHILHTRYERQDLLRKTLRFLESQGYCWNNEDGEFLHMIAEDLQGFKM